MFVCLQSEKELHLEKPSLSKFFDDKKNQNKTTKIQKHGLYSLILMWSTGNYKKAYIFCLPKI